MHCGPKRPTQISQFAVSCLEALASAGLGQVVSLRGASGLLHYLDFGPTNDIDALWPESATPYDRERVVAVVEHALAQFGDIRKREWGEVVSLELFQDNRTVFSCQIAERSAQLRDSVSVEWTDVQLDSPDDLIANKMVV